MFNSMTGKMQNSGKNAVKDAQYKTMFNTFDKDDSGFIDKSDIKEITKNSIIPEKHLLTIMNYVDRNGDGKVDFNEFKIIMKKIEKVKKYLPKI
jgi:Ca2+-binding EF-hand superfamily protein